MPQFLDIEGVHACQIKGQDLPSKEKGSQEFLYSILGRQKATMNRSFVSLYTCTLAPGAAPSCSYIHRRDQKLFIFARPILDRLCEGA